MCVGAPAGAFSEPKIATLCSFSTDNSSQFVCFQHRIWELLAFEDSCRTLWLETLAGCSGRTLWLETLGCCWLLLAAGLAAGGIWRALAVESGATLSPNPLFM